ncbi:MAG TPA: hypothetical protein VIV57_00070 [Anaeromyxobacter sp.]
MSSRVLLAVLALASAPSAAAAAAESTGPCHCYRVRAFDPARPEAADPYILATTRSSLLSAAFGPSKRDLVAAAMSGTSPEDLWIASWAAPRARREAAALLEARAKLRSWRAALAGAPGLSGPFAEALARGAPDAELAAIAVDDVLSGRLGADPAELAAARLAGASTSEVILAALLAARLGTAPATVLAPVKSGKATWGVALQALGLAPQDLDGLVRQAVRR